MKIEVREIIEQAVWEKVWPEFQANTFLHSWEWGRVQENLGHKVFRLGIFVDDKLSGLAFFYKITAKRGSFLFCPHGPFLDWENEDCFNELIKYIRQLAGQEKVDFVRISPLVLNQEKYVRQFGKNNFRPAPVHMMHPELAWILDVTLSEEELLKQMKKRHRNSIKKAEREGVEIIISENPADVDKFYDLYQATAERQNFVPFSRDYVKKEFEIFVQEKRASLFFASYNNELIATAIIIFSADSAFYHHGASIRKYSNIPGSEFLQWKAILECKRRGLKKYNFWGIAPEGEKNHPWSGLTEFKKGFAGYSEEYLHVQDLPLGWKYWINYFVETIRKIRKGY